MPTTQSYYDTLVAQADAAATAKKDALQAAYERLTRATVDDKGNITYAKDTSGNPLYGTMDVDYMAKRRMASAGAEASGMMRSGQYARTLAEGQAAYRAGILGSLGETTGQKTQVDKDLALEKAKYQAMYGNVAAGSGSSGSGTGGAGGTTTGGTGSMSPITAPPDNGISAPPLSGNRENQTIYPTTGRGGMGSPGTVVTTPNTDIYTPNRFGGIEKPTPAKPVAPAKPVSPPKPVTPVKPVVPTPPVIRKPGTVVLKPGGKK